VKKKAVAAIEEVEAEAGMLPANAPPCNAGEPLVESNSDHGDSVEGVLSSGSSSHNGMAKVGMVSSPCPAEACTKAKQSCNKMGEGRGL